jgi:hypothetical protein
MKQYCCSSLIIYENIISSAFSHVIQLKPQHSIFIAQNHSNTLTALVRAFEVTINGRKLQVSVELPMDSVEADEERQKSSGGTVLGVFRHGSISLATFSKTDFHNQPDHVEGLVVG